MALLSRDYHESQIKRAISGNYRPHGDIHKADCVIGVGFGYREQNGITSPSVSTDDLAHFVAAFEHLPKYLEHSLAHAYKAHKAGNVVGHLLSVNGGIQMETKQLLKELRANIKYHGHHYPMLIAHPNHVAWLDYLCGQIDLETIVPNGLQHIRFDSESVLPWTRSLEAWQNELKKRHDPNDERAYRTLFDSL